VDDVTSTPLRWGIVSTARINEQVLPAFSASPNAALEAVASRDAGKAQKYAEKHQIPRWYGSYEALFDDSSIDCVYISTPNATHAQWTEKALKSGKHVLCEKPLTPTAQEAKRLFDLAADNSMLLMEAFMYRHHPQTARAKDALIGGDIGDLQVIRMSFNFKTEDPATDVRYRPDLAGGALLDVGSYCVSFSNFVMDSTPDEVGGLARMRSSGVEEGFVGHMRYGDLLAAFDCSLFTPLDIGITAVGSEGRLTVPTPWYPHLPPQQIIVERGEERRVVDCAGSNAYELEVANFSSAVAGTAEPLISGHETLRNLETLERLARAAGLTAKAE
jgi:predicted dehydrogenase